MATELSRKENPFEDIPKISKALTGNCRALRSWRCFDIHARGFSAVRCNWYASTFYDPSAHPFDLHRHLFSLSRALFFIYSLQRMIGNVDHSRERAQTRELN